jgi:hypothetical protein
LSAIGLPDAPFAALIGETVGRISTSCGPGTETEDDGRAMFESPNLANGVVADRM